MAEIKTHFDFSNLKKDMPTGEIEEEGFCFRNALTAAGYDIDLPPWTHMDDIPIVCEELGLHIFQLVKAGQ